MSENIKTYLINLFCLFCLISFSQTTIRGTITTENKELLDGGNVIINDMDNNEIIAYDISDINGIYNLQFKSELDSLKIEAAYLGYSKQTIKIANKNQRLDFFLKPSNEKLKEVFIKNNPIRKKGDTLSYSVSIFKDQKDRVIADVLKKMPGIDVLADGKILYQGKPIQKYYIEGLDLLEGKYNLANNNLPASSVSKVQILENHQPIKLLDSILFSDKTSLNIKLKSNITTTGTANIGSGFSPFLWDGKITPMIFKKNKQFIGSYQTNNTGNDITSEIKYLTLEGLKEKLDGNSGIDNWLDVQNLATPSFSKKRWLNNNSHLITANYLGRIKKDMNFKVNLSYVNDFQNQKGETNTTFFIPNENVIFFENIQNKTYISDLKSAFILTKNSKKNYLKNTLKINRSWNSKQATVISNNKNEQSLSTPNIYLQNKLKWKFPFGKQIINFKSITNYTSNPQSLFVDYENSTLLNNLQSYKKIKQDLHSSNFYTNNSLGFTQLIKRISINSNLGLKLSKQKLSSSISAFDDNIPLLLSKAYKNNLTFNRYSLYSTFETQYTHNDWKISLNAPISIVYFDINDISLSKKQNLNKFLFEPNIIISKQINTFWKTGIFANINQKFGSIDQFHYSYILKKPLTLNRYENPILEQRNNSINFNLLYRNSIKSLFLITNYTLSNTNQNLISGTKINSNGLISLTLIDKENQFSTHNYNINGSKYFSSFKTTISLMSNFSISNKKQLLNQKLIDVNTENLFFESKINTKITSWLSVDVKNYFSINNTQYKSIKNQIVIQKHLLDLNFYPSSNQYIGIDTEYNKSNFANTKIENYFLNLKYRYTLKKQKIDFAFNWNNILNTKYLTSSFSTDFYQLQHVYMLRPSQVTLSAKFSLESLFNN